MGGCAGPGRPWSRPCLLHPHAGIPHLATLAGGPRGPRSTAGAAHFRLYDHALVCHAYWQLAAYGSLKKFATFFLEHANKWWKELLERHTSHGGGWRGEGSEPDHQVLRRFFLLTCPEVRSQFVAHLRERPVYTCHECCQPKLPGHSQRCHVIALKKAALAAATAAAEAGLAGPQLQILQEAASAAAAALEAARAASLSSKSP